MPVFTPAVRPRGETGGPGEGGSGAGAGTEPRARLPRILRVRAGPRGSAGARRPSGPVRPLRSAAPRPARRGRSAHGAGRLNDRGEGSSRDNLSLFFLPFIPFGSSENLCMSSPNSARPGSPVGASPSRRCSPLGGEGLPSFARLPEKGPGQEGAACSGCGLGNSRGEKAAASARRGRGGSAPAAGAGPATPRAGMPPRSPGLAVAPQGSVTQKGCLKSVSPATAGQ